MNIAQMLASLHAQREKLERLIDAAEDYARGAAKRRGRPPGWMKKPRRGRPPGSPNKKKPAAAATS